MKAELEFGGAATYRIVVNGALDEAWSERLAGMAIRRQEGEGESRTTTLVGPLL